MECVLVVCDEDCPQKQVVWISSSSEGVNDPCEEGYGEINFVDDGNTSAKTKLTLDTSLKGCWVMLSSTNFPPDTDYNNLDKCIINAFAKNIELYVGESEDCSERVYASTVRGEKVCLKQHSSEEEFANQKIGNGLYRFIITPEHLSHSRMGKGRFRNLYLRFLSLQQRPFKIESIRMKLLEVPDPTNTVKPSKIKFSAAASGGIGGVDQPDLDASVLFNMFRNDGALTNLPAAALSNFMQNQQSINKPTKKPLEKKEEKVATPFNSDDVLIQLGHLIDMKLAPLMNKMDVIANKVSAIEKILSEKLV